MESLVLGLLFCGLSVGTQIQLPLPGSKPALPVKPLDQHHYIGQPNMTLANHGWGNGNDNQWNCDNKPGHQWFCNYRECGKNSFTPSQISQHVVGGSDASPGMFPYQVAVVAEGYFICGGSYVNGWGGPKVITAAHCAGYADYGFRYSVIFGMMNFDDAPYSYWADVSKIIKHPEYNKDHFLAHDIAVFEIANVNMAAIDYVGASPVCLTKTTYSGGEPAVVAGWGTTSEGGFVSRQLQYLETQLIDYDACNSSPTLGAGMMHPSMMCAGKAGESVCHGDSGGALVRMRKGKLEQIGVVSWGIGCARPNSPGRYSDVWNQRWWLRMVGNVL